MQPRGRASDLSSSIFEVFFWRETLSEGNSQVLEFRSEFSILCVVAANIIGPYASICGPSRVHKRQKITNTSGPRPLISRVSDGT